MPACRPLYEISTHSPRVGRTPTPSTTTPPTATFQLTRPVWGEPYLYQRFRQFYNISTHSPRVGRTLCDNRTSISYIHFNSLAPCGANPVPVTSSKSNVPFQLTRPVWGEPDLDHCVIYRRVISTHSPRVGRTVVDNIVSALIFHFNSLAPCGANPSVIKRSA